MRFRLRFRLFTLWIGPSGILCQSRTACLATSAQIRWQVLRRVTPTGAILRQCGPVVWDSRLTVDGREL